MWNFLKSNALIDYFFHLLDQVIGLLDDFFHFLDEKIELLDDIFRFLDEINRSLKQENDVWLIEKRICFFFVFVLLSVFASFWQLILMPLWQTLCL